MGQQLRVRVKRARRIRSNKRKKQALKAAAKAKKTPAKA
jgi:hypothetical protein